MNTYEISDCYAVRPSTDSAASLSRGSAAARVSRNLKNQTTTKANSSERMDMDHTFRRQRPFRIVRCIRCHRHRVAQLTAPPALGISRDRIWSEESLLVLDGNREMCG